MSPETGIDSEERYEFLLFVSGMSAKSLMAIDNLRKIGEKYLKGQFDLDIVDITANPDQAQQYQLIGIPTMIKISPDPKRIIIGDLSDTAKVLRILEIENGS